MTGMFICSIWLNQLFFKKQQVSLLKFANIKAMILDFTFGPELHLYICRKDVFMKTTAFTCTPCFHSFLFNLSSKTFLLHGCI